MEQSREEAWKHLTQCEKQSIYLTTAQGLSSCKVCEILVMTKYKYLELKARSETLFRTFSDYYSRNNHLIRPGCPIKPGFRDYITGCLLLRLPMDEALVYAGEGLWSTRRIRDKEVEEGMKTLLNSTHSSDNDLYKLIQEFDRWNSFRILPDTLQAPSPYRRKTNRVVKKYFKYLRSIPFKTIERITRTLSYKGKDKWYIALLSDELPDQYQVISVEANKKNLDHLTNQRFYIFKEPHNAVQFATMVIRQPRIQASREGMDFWKDYDELIQNAINFESISHTTSIQNRFDDHFSENYKKANL